MKLSVEYDPRTEIAPVVGEGRISYSSAGRARNVRVDLLDAGGHVLEVPTVLALSRGLPEGPFRVTIVIEPITPEPPPGAALAASTPAR